MFEVKVKELTKESYNQVSSRIIFLSKRLVKVQIKNPIPTQDKSCLQLPLTFLRTYDVTHSRFVTHFRILKY